MQITIANMISITDVSEPLVFVRVAAYSLFAKHNERILDCLTRILQAVNKYRAVTA